MKVLWCTIYQAIDKEVEAPIFIQNHARGSVFSIDTMVRLINEVEHVEYVKEETFPVTHMITELIDQAGPVVEEGIWWRGWTLFIVRTSAWCGWADAWMSRNRCGGAVVECTGGWGSKGGQTGVWLDGTVVCIGDPERHPLP